MTEILILIFIATYAAIAFEHPLNVNKSAPALIGAGLMWALYAGTSGHAAAELDDTLAQIAQIVFFLMGAMTIVEVIDAHDGFEVITERIRTRSMVALLWMVGLATFFLSAVLDNLTTTIVMLSVNRKLLARHEDRLYAAGIVVIAANAGGAWSPIGDVTTTMLWIGGQISVLAVIYNLFLPSLVNLLVPLAAVSLVYRGKNVVPPQRTASTEGRRHTPAFEKRLMFLVGIGLLCAVPVFKTLTHLPPFMGILFGLGLLWLLGELLHAAKPEPQKQHLTLAAALQRIDMASLVFFVGILLAVAVLEHNQILASLAHWLDDAVGNQAAIVSALGLISAIIDNVPLVAATMGMYPLADYPTDSFLWEFLAYAAGTGGSILIIGSAAGVAAMGLEKIEFFWYARRFSLLALAGYAGGAMTYMMLNSLR